MISKFTFYETIKRIFSCITNSQIICNHWLKEYISDVKIISESKKKETSYSKSILKNNNDSSQNLINVNNIASKTNNSIHPIFGINNSFMFLNSSLNSINFERLEGLIFECKWKKKYILTLKILKINESDKFFKLIDLECLEMNHYEKAFNLQIRLYWNSYELKTHLLLKFIPKYKIIEEIINREFNTKDKKRIYNLLNDYLINDLTNLENCLTTLVFTGMRNISFYLRDIKNIIKFDDNLENKRFEFYESPLIKTVQNCRVYDPKNNKLMREYVFAGYFADKKKACQIRWEKRENNKIFCIFRISISYLEENISLLIFKNAFQEHVTTKYLSDVNIRKKAFFNELRNYFNKKNIKFGYQSYEPKNLDIKLIIAIKADIEDDEDKNDLNLFINNQVTAPNNETNIGQNQIEKQHNSLAQTISLIDGDDKESDNIFGDSIQNISEIKNNNSTFLCGLDNDNPKN